METDVIDFGHWDAETTVERAEALLGRDYRSPQTAEIVHEPGPPESEPKTLEEPLGPNPQTTVFPMPTIWPGLFDDDEDD